MPKPVEEALAQLKRAPFDEKWGQLYLDLTPVQRHRFRDEANKIAKSKWEHARSLRQVNQVLVATSVSMVVRFFHGDAEAKAVFDFLMKRTHDKGHTFKSARLMEQFVSLATKMGKHPAGPSSDTVKLVHIIENDTIPIGVFYAEEPDAPPGPKKRFPRELKVPTLTGRNTKKSRSAARRT